MVELPGTAPGSDPPLICFINCNSIYTMFGQECTPLCFVKVHIIDIFHRRNLKSARVMQIEYLVFDGLDRDWETWYK